MKIKRMLEWMVGALLLSAAAVAEPVQSASSDHVFLYEHWRGNSRRVNGPFLPDRLHARFDPRFKRRIWVMSDLAGNLPPFGRGLIAGSVVRGERMGTPNRGRFRLSGKGKWEPTKESEVFLVYADGPKPSLRHLYPPP